jgi:hypothetical protein
MATTTNYGWTTPDDTALVKDGAAAIRTLGSSIDSTLKTQIDAQIPDSLLTTAGDTIYASGASTPARLGIGSTGQVLTVSAGVPSWATPSAPTEDFVLINTGGTTLSGSEVTISGISGKNRILVRIDSAVSTATAQNLTLRLNADGGNNYRTYGIRNGGTIDDSIIDKIPLAPATTQSNQNLHASLLFFGCNSTNFKPFFIATASDQTGEACSGGGQYRGTSAISSVRINTTGTFSSGTIYVYGA